MNLRVRAKFRAPLVPNLIRSHRLCCIHRYTPVSFDNTIQRRTLTAFRIPKTSTQMSSPSPPGKSKVLVFGAGNFGSCLADHLGDSQHDVFMWSREADLVEHFNVHHRNLRYLKDHDFSSNITAIGPDLPDRAFLGQMDVLLFAIPTQGLRFVSPHFLHASVSRPTHLCVAEKPSQNYTRVLMNTTCLSSFLSTRASKSELMP